MARTQIASANILASARDTFNTFPPTPLAAAATMYIAGGTGTTEQDFRSLSITPSIAPLTCHPPGPSEPRMVTVVRFEPRMEPGQPDRVLDTSPDATARASGSELPAFSPISARSSTSECSPVACSPHSVHSLV